MTPASVKGLASQSTNMPRGRAEIKEWAKQGAGGRPETWRTLPQVKVIERVALLVAGVRDFFDMLEWGMPHRIDGSRIW